MNTKVGKGSLRAVDPAPENERAPTYKGSLEIEGRKYWLSGWRRLDEQTGKYWLSLSVEAADQPKPQRTYAQRRDFDGD